MLTSNNVYLQTKKIDSLYNAIRIGHKDTNKVNAFNELSREISALSPKSSLKFAQKARILAENINYYPGQVRALINAGMSYYLTNDNTTALETFLYAEKLLDRHNNDLLRSDLYNDIALVQVKAGNLKTAEKYFMKSIELDKKTNNLSGIASSYNNLGSIYATKNQLNKAKEYFELSKEFISKSGSDKYLALTLSNLASINIHFNNLATASRQINQSLLLYQKNDDISGIATVYNKIGDLKLKQNNPVEAETYYLKSLNVSRKYKLHEMMAHSCELLSIIYEQRGDYKNAMSYIRLGIKTNEKLFDIEKSKNFNEIQAKYASAKRQKELIKRNAEIHKKNSQIKIFGITLGLILILVLYIGYSLWEKQKINKIILRQKDEVELQNTIIEEKNNVVESQNKDIKDSIKYAKRIQSAILPHKERWDNILKESFVVYKPKDILSGDFNWIAETESHIFVAAADCTGHGVPGAIISIVNYNLLNKAVLERGITDTSEILDAVNEWLTDSLHQRYENSTVKDGMDISLISIDKNTRELNFSGAFNSLYLVTENGLTEFKGNKMPVGAFVDDVIGKFTKHTINVKKGDMIYLCSDGYADQFGGFNNKKYKYKRLKENFVDIQKFNMQYQKDFLLTTFENWKGNNEQVDDVLIIGIRIS